MSIIEVPRSREVPNTFAPETSPYETVFVDITHRCNMTCANCYVPNREIPDLDTTFLLSVLRRLPLRRFIRLSGGEPTLRRDLPEIVAAIRNLGHHPIVMTNGLKFADRSYVRALKNAGLEIAYLSMNGGFDDDLYDTIDEMRCADRKRAAFENLRAERLFTSVGMILVRGVNEQEVTALLTACRKARNVREFHLRSVGAMGRHMNTDPLTLSEMQEIFCTSAAIDPSTIVPHERTATSIDFTFERMRVQFTVWPDLGSTTRGRLTPDGMIAPAMEHSIANEFGY